MAGAMSSTIRLHPFDEALALQAVPGGFSGTGDSRFANRIGPFGGYVAALLLKAVTEKAGPGRPPLSMTVDFLARVAGAPFRIETSTERDGRTLVTVTARLIQEGRVCAIALVTCLERGRSPVLLDAAPPDLPPPDALPPVVHAGDEPPLREQFEFRVATGQPWSGSPTTASNGWMRTPQPRRMDYLLVACLADATPPTVWTRLSTLAPFATSDGISADRTLLWTADRRLVAECQQIGRVRFED
jgi:hypothetical protein